MVSQKKLWVIKMKLDILKLESGKAAINLADSIFGLELGKTYCIVSCAGNWLGDNRAHIACLRGRSELFN